MPTYIQFYKWTRAGIETVKDQPVRSGFGKELFKSMGVEVKALYFAFGKQDMITINEAPNDEAMAAAALKLASLGPVEVETIRVFTEAEAYEIIKGIP
jgi:uncharacterized protein with GYD domain